MRSHFQFSKQQRNGIFLLLILIVMLQSVYFFYANNSFNTFLEKDLALNTQELDYFRAEIDSLKKAKANESKKYLFNPNFITDFKGYSLGMSNEEIDRLLEYRKKNKWVNSVKDFQQITKVSDSLLAILAPKFRFPEWVNHLKKFNRSFANKKSVVVEKSYEQKIDLNVATLVQLKKVIGIGDKLSKRIITYRSNKKGFVSDIELQEIYGLSSDVIVSIKKLFTVKTPRDVKKISLNSATRDELVKIHYIDYNIAYNIIEARTLRGSYKSLNDLTKVKDFPLNKFEIIKLYLQLD